MITPSFSLTATERVLPRLALDFTTASLDSRITFTRTGNTATRVNSSGYIESINANLPRFDYDPITLVCKGLLIEEARTNLLTNSQTFSGWTAANSSVAASLVLSPDNTSYLYFLTEAASAAVVHLLGLAVAATPSFAVSCFAKASTRNFITLAVNNGSSNNFVSATFDLSNGTVASSAGGSTAGTVVSTSIINYGNGIYRCVLVGSLTGAVNINIALTTTGTPTRDAFGRQTYAGDGTSGLYVWGAQFEAGAFPTSYIPTTTTALTRNADVATMTGTNFSDFWNNTQGAFSVFWTQYFLKTTGQPFVFSAQGSLRAPQTTNGTRYYGQTSGNSFALQNITTTTQNGVCVAYAANTAEVLSSKGASILTNSGSFTGAAPTQFAIGHDGSGTNQISGHFQKLLYWPQRLTNAEVQAFSKG